MRGGRLSLAQEWEGRGWVASAWLVRRPGQAPPRRRDVVVHHGDAPATGRRTRTASHERADGSSLARVGGRRRTRDDPDAWRPEPLERGQGSLVGTAAD